MPAPSVKTGLLTAITLCAFASNSLFCRAALAHTSIDAGSFTAIRLLSGALMLAAIVRARGTGPVLGSWAGAVALIAYAVAFSFAYVSLPTGTGALLQFAAVQGVMIAYGLLKGERLRLLQWSGLGLALAGLVALLGPGLAKPDPFGAALMLAAGAAWGVYTIFGRTVGDPLATTAGNFLRTLPFLIPLTLLSPHRLDAWGIVWAVLSGALASGVGYSIWYAALKGLTATTAASVQLSVPVIAAVCGVVLLGEALSVQLIVASASILGGIALVFRGAAGR